jgi:hypothetical protein
MMKLYSRAWVRGLRKDALTTMRGNKPLWQDYKRHRKRFELSLRQKATVAVPLLLVALATILSAVKDVKPGMPLVILALYCTGTIVFRGQAFRARLYLPGELSIFAVLPVEDSIFFDLLWRKFLLRTLSLFAIAIVIYLSLGSWQLSFSTIGAAVLAASLQWVLACSLALFVVRIKGPLMQYLAMGLYAVGLIGALAPLDLTKYFLPVVSVLPAGWINLVHNNLAAGKPEGLLWAVPVLALTATGIFQLRRLRSEYSTGETSANAQANTDRDTESIREQETPQETPDEIDIRERWIPIIASQRIIQGELRHVPDWNSNGWIEKFAGKWLTSQEKATADLMTGGALGQWSANWKKAVLVTLAATMMAFLVPAVPVLAAGIAIAIAAALAAPLLGGRWLGFAPIIAYMNRTYVAALYPVDYWRVSRVIFKINFVRIAAWSLLFVPSFVVLASRTGLSLGQSIGIAGELLIFMIAWQFPAVALLHSKSTNDTTRYNFNALLLVLVTLIWFTTMLVGIIAAAIMQSWYGALIGGTTTLACSALAWLFYGWLFTRGKVDLVRVPDTK